MLLTRLLSLSVPSLASNLQEWVGIHSRETPKSMSSIANIVAFDGAATPVSHTLLPVSVVKEKGKITASWREAASGVPVYAQVRCSMTMEQLASKVYRLVCRVEVPVQEVVTGSNSAGYSAQPKVAYINTVETTGMFSERSDVTGRRLVRQLALNIGGSVSTSVAAATTGPVPELFDLLTAPT